MLTTDITPAMRIPPRPHTWGRSRTPTPLESSATRAELAIRELEADAGLRVRLHSDSIGVDGHDHIAALIARGLRTTDHPLTTLRDDITARIRAAEAKRKSQSRCGVFNVMHLHDDAGVTIEAVRNLLAPLPVNHEWQAIAREPTREQLVAQLRAPGHWIKSVDGVCITPANMRAWANAAARTLDLLVSASPDAPGAIVFALAHITAGGFAAIHIPRLDTATVSAIHMFTQYFDRSAMVGNGLPVSESWLIGSGRILPLTARVSTSLHQWVGELDDALAPFNDEHMESPAMRETVEALARFDGEVISARHAFYKRMLAIRARLPSDPSRTDIEANLALV